MEDKVFDAVLKKALAPSMQAAESLDQAILERLLVAPGTGDGGEGKNPGTVREIGKSRKWKARHFLPKVAAIVLVIAVAGTGSVYAAGKILDKIRVTTHGISTGNEEYIDDEALAQPWESVEIENKGEEAPGPDDKWTKKRSELVSGTYLNVYYTYEDYATAVADTRFESLFSEIPGKEQSVVYCTTDLQNDTMEYSLDSIFEYETGVVSVSQSVVEGNVASDASYGIVMKQTGNTRTYVSKSGTEFTLVDDLGAGEDGLSTMVMISSDDFRGCIGFRGLTEDEIKQVLDKVIL